MWLVAHDRCWTEFRFRQLKKIGMQSLAPQLAETSFDDWWEKILGETEEQTKQGLNSVVILGAWWNI
jgi:nuclear pore complex protein Nup210